MVIILGLFGVVLSMGLFLVVSDIMDLPTRRAIKAIVVVEKREKRKLRSFELLINDLAMRVSVLIKLTPYQRRKLVATLKSAEIKVSPETYVAKAWVKAGLTLFLIIPALIIFPIVFPLIIFLAIAVYFKEIRSVDEAIRKRRENIENELPRFVATLTQEFKANRNVLTILESYKSNAGIGLKRELEITVADMKSGSYESALTRFESRLGSPKVSDVVRGLIGVIRGDDGVVYFQMLSHDLKQLEIQRLKTIAMKRPGKIRKYSFAMLFCFLLMYLSVMFLQILSSFEKMF